MNRLLLVLAAVLAIAAALPASAQERTRQSAKLPQAFEGLGVSSNDPIQFEAEALEVREQDRVAIFSGNVVVRQNDTVLKTASLIVTYAGDDAAAGAQQVKKLEAAGSVLVTSGPQTASGDNAVFDTEANTIVVTGNVVLTQGANVIRGPRLVIDINSGQAKMAGGRVQMLIEPKSLRDNKSGG